MKQDKVDIKVEIKAPKKRKFCRKIIRFFLFLVIFIILLALFLPAILSSGPGTGIIVSIANNSSGQQVTIDDLSLSWFSPCSITGLSVKDDQNRQIADIKEVTLSRSIVDLATNWQKFGDIVVDSLELNVYLPEENDSPEKAPNDKKTTEKTQNDPEIPKITGTFAIKNSKVKVIKPNGQIYSLVDINTNVSVAKQLVVLTGSMVNGAGGTVNLDGMEMELTDPLRFTVKDTTKLLEEITIDEVIADDFLAEINPIFANQANLSGKISLELKQTDVPLNENIKNAATGKFGLDLTELTFQPQGFMGKVMDLAGANKAYTFDIKGFKLGILDGRINYDDLTIKISDELHIKFFGSVALADNDLALKMSFPVTAQLLNKAGLKLSDAEKYAKSLSDRTVVIPIIGTKEDPKMDFSTVPEQLKDVLKGGVADIIKTETESQIDKLLDKALDNDDKEKDKKKNDQNDLIKEGIKNIFGL
ncbi:MAG: hypothetical protein JEZ07_19690 [Phycisphaerae bacterium]|nr:hypothetical protein [Phycisphaerae bacterium]